MELQKLQRKNHNWLIEIYKMKNEYCENNIHFSF